MATRPKTLEQMRQHDLELYQAIENRTDLQSVISKVDRFWQSIPVTEDQSEIYYRGRYQTMVGKARAIVNLTPDQLFLKKLEQLESGAKQNKENRFLLTEEARKVMALLYPTKNAAEFGKRFLAFIDQYGLFQEYDHNLSCSQREKLIRDFKERGIELDPPNQLVIFFKNLFSGLGSKSAPKQKTLPSSAYVGTAKSRQILKQAYQPGPMPPTFIQLQRGY